MGPRCLGSFQHCVLTVDLQGGKGRTGLFVSALLLWVGFRPTVGECLDFFSSRRTDKSISSSRNQGVTAPSQLRYSQYISSVLKQKKIDYRSPDFLILRSIVITTVPFAKQILGVKGECLSCINLQFLSALPNTPSRQFLTLGLHFASCRPISVVLQHKM